MFLELNDLTMQFGGLVAVDQVNIEVKQNTIHGLIGPNGSGKTTIFNMISGYYEPTSGTISLEGVPVAGRPPHVITEMGFARTFQNMRLFHSMTVLENVLTAMNQHARLSTFQLLLNPIGVRREERDLHEKAMDILRLLEIDEYAGELATNLSYGLQRRVEMARALATEPKILLLDEPAAGLSTTEADTLMDVIFQLRESGITVFLVEHHMRVVMNVCDVITVLDHGSKIAEGDPEAVSCDERVIEAYLGTECVT
jgi:ABC-type branched-subunit amino acid transport system ATPase component